MFLSCISTNCGSVSPKFSISEYRLGGNENSRRSSRCALGITLVAGLLLISVLSPILASAQTKGTSRAVSVRCPDCDSGSNESVILFDEPATEVSEAHEAEVSETHATDGSETHENESLAASAPAALLKYLEAKQCADIDGTASLLLTGIEIAKSAGYATPDPLLLACLAKPESKFNDSAVGHAGELGLLQVHPCHKRSMQRLGLDFHSGADRVAYACVLWNASGLKPWSTRRVAQSDYRTWSEK